MSQNRYKYRVFVSYSHADIDLKRRVERHLERLGAEPISDKAFGPGVGIDKQIHSRIAYAHLLLPIITGNSDKSAYVQNEIGYAFGVCVPILPLCVGTTPTGMLKGLLAARVRRNLKGLRAGLTKAHLKKAIEEFQDSSRPAFVCAEQTFERCALIRGFVKAVERMQPANRLRYRAAFTSFSIPRDPDDYRWELRDGKPRSPEIRRQLSQERLALERHAKMAGCDLEIDPFVHPYQRITSGPNLVVYQNPDLSKKCRLTRLQILREFVAEMPNQKIRVIVRENQLDGNLLIFGNWFLVESKAPRPGAGFLQSVLTQHAPWILSRIVEFDENFQRRYSARPTNPQADALEKIDQCIKKIEQWPDEITE